MHGNGPLRGWDGTKDVFLDLKHASYASIYSLGCIYADGLVRFCVLPFYRPDWIGQVDAHQHDFRVAPYRLEGPSSG